MKHAWLYSYLLKAFKGDILSSGFSTNESLISASAIPHCGCTVKQRMMTSEFSNKNGCFLGLKLVKVKGSRSRPSTY